MTCSLVCSPSTNWVLSAGYAFNSNWIDQDIVLPSDDPTVRAETYRFNYGGRSHMVSFGATHRINHRLALSGYYQFLRGENSIDPFSPWPDLATLSDVLVEQVRMTFGADWRFDEQMFVYSRYQFEDFQDESAHVNSGTAHMFLMGLTRGY